MRLDVRLSTPHPAPPATHTHTRLNWFLPLSISVSGMRGICSRSSSWQVGQCPTMHCMRATPCATRPTYQLLLFQELKQSLAHSQSRIYSVQQRDWHAVMAWTMTATDTSILPGELRGGWGDCQSPLLLTCKPLIYSLSSTQRGSSPFLSFNHSFWLKLILKYSLKTDIIVEIVQWHTCCRESTQSWRPTNSCTWYRLHAAAHVTAVKDRLRSWN